MIKGAASLTFRFVVVCVSILLLCPPTVANPPARPVNDDYTNAISLPGLMMGQPITYSSVGATREPSEPDGGDRVPNLPAVWWKWKPSIDSRYATFHAGRGRMAIFRALSFSPVPQPWVYVDASNGSEQIELSFGSTESQTPAYETIGRETYTVHGDFTFVADASFTYYIADLSSTPSNTFTIRQYFSVANPSASYAGRPTTFTMETGDPVPPPDHLEVHLEKYLESSNNWTRLFTTNYLTTSSWALTVPEPGCHRAILNATYLDGRNWSMDVIFPTAAPKDDSPTPK